MHAPRRPGTGFGTRDSERRTGGLTPLPVAPSFVSYETLNSSDSFMMRRPELDLELDVAWDEVEEWDDACMPRRGTLRPVRDEWEPYDGIPAEWSVGIRRDADDGSKEGLPPEPEVEPEAECACGHGADYHGLYGCVQSTYNRKSRSTRRCPCRKFKEQAA